MDAVVLTDGRDNDPEVVTASGSNVLPTAIRDALPQLFVETALPLALIDAEGTLLTVNSGFCALAGRTATTLAGARLGDVLHPDDRIAHLAAWHALLGGITRADRVSTRLLRPDGTVVPVTVYRTVLARSSGRAKAIGFAAFHEEPAVSSQPAPQTGITAFACELAANASDQESIGRVISQTLARLGGDAAWTWCLDDEHTLHLLDCWHPDSTRQAALADALQQPVPTETGLVAEAVSSRRITHADQEVRDASDPLVVALGRYAATFGIADLMLLPLAAGEHIVGLVGFIRDGGAASYETETVDGVSAYASTAALGLSNAVALANARSDERFARSVLDAMPVMSAVLDGDGRIIDVNAAWLRAMDTYGGPLHTGIGENYLHLWDTAAATGVIGAAEVAGGVRDVLNGSRAEFSGDCTYPQVDPHGGPTELWFHVHATQLSSARTEGHPMVVVDHQDITDRKRLEARLSYEATHDPLTRLPNRTLLIDRVEQALVRDRRAGLRTAVLFCDLDYFKQINDQFGHDGGDAVLRAVARRFARTVRASDTVARIGGDEFVVLIESVSDLEEALLVADKLVLSLRESHPSVDAGDPPLPGVSVGVAVSHDTSTAESLLSDADAAMYTAKQTGRSRVEAAPN